MVGTALADGLSHQASDMTHMITFLPGLAFLCFDVSNFSVGGTCGVHVF